ncbi:hypothetical protein DPEC_G00003390 [Dallia pectoralis]|uniref:Uncharacterized protein n=1 Tax=Dallia pectoralis TaxID=75939 RepID=A0ACC2HKC3_DALPE|nr:hypothetical protein DPEC_G00003390 [Dallia pectoralis]
MSCYELATCFCSWCQVSEVHGESQAAWLVLWLGDYSEVYMSLQRVYKVPTARRCCGPEPIVSPQRVWPVSLLFVGCVQEFTAVHSVAGAVEPSLPRVWPVSLAVSLSNACWCQFRALVASCWCRGPRSSQ